LSLLFEAGMQNIGKNKKIIKPIYGNLYTKSRKELEDIGVELLPDSLGIALAITAQSNFVKEVLGEHSFSKFIKLKFNE
jgi:glutamine synthetase